MPEASTSTGHDWFFTLRRYFSGAISFFDLPADPMAHLDLAHSMTSQPIPSGSYGRPVLLGLLATLTFVVSACGEGGPPGTGEDESAPAVIEEIVEGVVVDIDLDEYNIIMDLVIPAGPVTLKLWNRGFEEHNLLFVVTESDSTIWETERRLGPGQRREVSLTFPPGAYKAICDFSGHEGRGMVAEFVAVEETPPEGGN